MAHLRGSAQREGRVLGQPQGQEVALHDVVVKGFVVEGFGRGVPAGAGHTGAGPIGTGGGRLDLAAGDQQPSGQGI